MAAEAEPLSDRGAAVMRAIVERLLPTDATGPGALEMHVDRYVLDGLAGPIAHLRDVCEEGLAALSAAAVRLHGGPFETLAPKAQDDLLERLERDEIEEIPDGAGFFNVVHHLMLEGAFSDPRHGGNHGMAGWELLGFPGLRLEVSAAEQALDTAFEGPRRSIVDYPELPRD